MADADPARDLPKGLVYFSDAMPGYTRRRRGRGFEYLDTEGCTIERGPERERIEALAVPPAYRSVWICPAPEGHLQATGYDERERKQYRYHPRWQEYRSTRKFDGLAEFALHLPRIRRRILADLKREEIDKPLVAAAVARLLDRAHMRVGGGDATITGARGATGLEHRNLKVAEGRIRLDYTAKGGKRVRRQLSDATLMRVLERIDNLPGRALFKYRGRDGALHRLDSGDVNRWLKDAARDERVSAKTFRTWSGTLAAFRALRADEPTIKALCEAAADTLRNTPAICRNSYVHPDVIALVEKDRETLDTLLEVEVSPPRGLTKDEARLARFLGVDI